MDASAKLAKVGKALARLQEHEQRCRLCPRGCSVNRSRGERGFCGAGIRAGVSHTLRHFGEEPVLSGLSDCAAVETGASLLPRRGSGTVFFTGCHLKCVYCQNFQISWQGRGKDLSDEALAAALLELQEQGAANINLVSPTHVLPSILKALREAFRAGLNLPIVYNSNGYESAAVLRELEGIVDIYLPDLKYVDSMLSGRLSGAPDYFKAAKTALIEMYCQQPVLETDAEGLASRGLIVRHLVLPGSSDDSLRVLDWLRRYLSPAVGLSLMSQYYPCHQAPPGLRRTLTASEYDRVCRHAEALGFEKLFLQPQLFSGTDNLIPDFALPQPFRWHGE